MSYSIIVDPCAYIEGLIHIFGEPINQHTLVDKKFRTAVIEGEKIEFSMDWNEMIEYAKLNTDTFIVKDAPCGTQIDLAIYA